MTKQEYDYEREYLEQKRQREQDAALGPDPRTWAYWERLID